MISLFHSQVYMDAWDDYQRSLHRSNFTCWDYIILTASNEQQAEGFRAQLQKRKEAGFLPSRTHFAVLPDPEGKRVGSGGATLNVIRYIAQREGTADFQGLRILVIHSGGDSKRVPQYSALGKLFSPVPRELPNGKASTLFDEFLISMAGVPSRIREGMLLLSGDVLLLFNPLLIDYQGKGAAALSFKEHVETGKNHGVYLRGEDGNVAKCLQKQTVEALKQAGAVNEKGYVDIDTGAVIFSPQMLASLWKLIADNHCDAGQDTCQTFRKDADQMDKPAVGEVACDPAKFAQFVNDKVRLSLYADFLYPLGTQATLEAFYKEKPEGEFSEELTIARTAVWEALRPYRMKLLRLAPSKFIHFGTTKEILRLLSEEIEQYNHLGWSKCVNSSIAHQRVAGYNSVLSSEAVCGNDTYLESSYVHSRATVGSNVLLSYVDIHDQRIPDNVVMHGLKQKDGRFVVRIYGIEDNPKGTLEEDCSFLSTTLKDFIEKNQITMEELWEEENHSLWTAGLYPVCYTISEAVEAALNLYAMCQGSGDVASWRAASRKSLCAGFQDADADALLDWDSHMQEIIAIDGLVKMVKAGEPVSRVKSITTAKYPFPTANESLSGNQTTGNLSLTKTQQEWLEGRLERADFGEAMRLHYYIGKALGGSVGEMHLGKCFQVIQETIFRASMEKLQENKNCRIVSDKHTVQLPLRVNWGGGWSDTPPHCMERGGTVLNAAILLNGRMPVEVSFTRLDDHKIIFESHDMGTYGEFDHIEPLQQVGDPYDPFALQKAALVACGIIPAKGGDLETILRRLGGGFLMQTEVTGVPKGSGLGTSSILAAASVKALLEFTGISYTEDDLYSLVLLMEQIMSTGGGWQDQVGGLSGGIKYATTMPGLHQQIKVTHLQLPKETMDELNERFCLIYTGQRRLARNLLRDVVGRYIGNEPDALYALNEIQRTAALMRFELERGNVDAFAKLLGEHWELSKKLDGGSTNTLIDQIFSAVEQYVDGKMICGAGGGGFLQVMLKTGVKKEWVEERLKSVFQDSDIGVWDCRIV